MIPDFSKLHLELRSLLTFEFKAQKRIRVCLPEDLLHFPHDLMGVQDLRASYWINIRHYAVLKQAKDVQNVLKQSGF